MTDTGVSGFSARMCFQAASPIDTTATPVAFLSENLALKGELIRSQGTYGTRSYHKERTRVGNQVVAGTIEVEITPPLLVFLLPRILGADASGTTFALAETLPAFQIMIDRGTDVFTYADCVISKATFKGAAGGQVTLSLDILGVSETVGGSFPSLTTPIDQPYIFSDGALSLASTAYQMMDFELSVDNKCEARWTNSNTATRIAPVNMREVALALTTPFTSTEYARYAPAIAGIAGSVTITNGTVSCLFSMVNLQAPPESPTVTSKGEVPMKLNYMASMSGTTKELIVTNDSTV